MEKMKKKLINKKETPFTYTLFENIPWHMIRDFWYKNIREMLIELAKAERENKLNETIQKIEKYLTINSCIYDYVHVLSALNETKKQFNF